MKRYLFSLLMLIIAGGMYGQSCGTTPLSGVGCSETEMTFDVVETDGIWTVSSEIGTSVNNGTVTLGTTSVEVTDSIFYTKEGICADTLLIVVNPLPTLTINDKFCDQPLTLETYTINFEVTGGTVTSCTDENNSEVGVIDNGQVTEIPAETDVTLTGTSLNNCTIMTNVTAPNCDCPTINAPTSGGDKEVCQGGMNPSLSVEVLGGETVDWYDVESGGSVLPNGVGTTSYMSSETGVDSYRYYAEARNTTSNCVSTTRTKVTLTIKENPIVSNTDTTGTTCSGDMSSGFTLTSTPMGASYAWTSVSSGVTGATVSGVGNIPVETLTGSGTVTYTVTPTLDDCEGETKDFIITVISRPAIDFMGTTDTVCVGDSIKLFEVANEATSWSWTGPEEYNSTMNNPIIPEATSDIGGLYFLAATKNDCTSYDTIMIVVNNLPSLALNGPYDDVCQNADSVVLSASPVNGIWSGTGVVDGVQGAGLFGPNQDPNSYNLFYDYTHPTTGCSSTGQTKITVKAIPESAPKIESIYNPIYYGDKFNLNGEDSSTNPVGGSLSYNWTLSDGLLTGSDLSSIKLVDVHALDPHNDFIAILNITDNNTYCSNNDTIDIDILEIGGCTAFLDLNQKTTFCHDESVIMGYIIESGTFTVNLKQYKIDNGDYKDLPSKSGDLNLEVLPSGKHTLYIYFETNDGSHDCGGEYQFEFIVEPKPSLPVFSNSDQDTLCSGDKWHIMIGGIESGTEIFYNLHYIADDTITTNSLIETTDNPFSFHILDLEEGDYILEIDSISSVNGCGSDSTKSISVHVLPKKILSGLELSDNAESSNGSRFCFSDKEKTYLINNTDNIKETDSLVFNFYTGEEDSLSAFYQYNIDAPAIGSSVILNSLEWNQFELDISYYYNIELTGNCSGSTATRKEIIIYNDNIELTLSHDTVCQNQNGILALAKPVSPLFDFRASLNDWSTTDGLQINSVETDSAYYYAYLNALNSGKHYIMLNDTLGFKNSNLKCPVNLSDSIIIRNSNAPDGDTIIHWPGHLLSSTADTTLCRQWGRDYKNSNNTWVWNEPITNTDTSMVNISDDNMFLFVEKDTDFTTWLGGDRRDSPPSYYWVDLWDCSQDYDSACVQRVYFNADGTPVEGLRSGKDEPDDNITDLYPNPNTGQFDISIEGSWGGKYDLDLYDLLGRHVQHESISKDYINYSHTIDVSDNVEGLLILAITNANGYVRIHKVMVEK